MPVPVLVEALSVTVTAVHMKLAQQAWLVITTRGVSS
jgi:hypothetical protein